MSALKFIRRFVNHYKVNFDVKKRWEDSESGLKLYTFASYVELKAKELVVKQGDPSQEVFIVLKGKVAVLSCEAHQTDPAPSDILALLSKGRALGDLGVVYHSRRYILLTPARPLASVSRTQPSSPSLPTCLISTSVSPSRAWRETASTSSSPSRSSKGGLSPTSPPSAAS